MFMTFSVFFLCRIEKHFIKNFLQKKSVFKCPLPQPGNRSFRLIFYFSYILDRFFSATIFKLYLKLLKIGRKWAGGERYQWPRKWTRLCYLLLFWLPLIFPLLQFNASKIKCKKSFLRLKKSSYNYLLFLSCIYNRIQLVQHV